MVRTTRRGFFPVAGGVLAGLFAKACGAGRKAVTDDSDSSYLAEYRATLAALENPEAYPAALDGLERDKARIRELARRVKHDKRSEKAAKTKMDSSTGEGWDLRIMVGSIQYDLGYTDCGGHERFCDRDGIVGNKDVLRLKKADFSYWDEPGKFEDELRSFTDVGLDGFLTRTDGDLNSPGDFIHGVFGAPDYFKGQTMGSMIRRPKPNYKDHAVRFHREYMELVNYLLQIV